jgi:hypothetical protein
MTDSAIDRKSIRRREKAAAIANRQRQEVITGMMTTMAGRQWIWDLLTSAHMFDANTISDPRLSGIFDGERNLGLRLLSDIMVACPDQFIQAMREANDRAHTDERRSSPEPDGGDPGSVDPNDPDYDPYTTDDDYR